ncbi:MAG: hypothetical protein ABFD89_06685 [Bryobacteraceae bacterium]
MNEPHFFDRPYPGEVLVAIWARGHDPLDSAIKFLTHGRGTHAAFIRASGNVIENFYPRVHERGWNPGERAGVEEYRLAGSTPEDWAALERWFADQLRNPPPYSIPDLLRYAVNLPPRHGAACFCSMWVLRGIRLNLPACKQPLARLDYPDFASPRDLRLSPLLIKRRKFIPVVDRRKPGLRPALA